MHSTKTVVLVRALMAVGLGVSLGACALGGPDRSPSTADESENLRVDDRFDADGLYSNAPQLVTAERSRVSLDSLDEDAPETYTVVRGDTLWDISDRFLKEPWLWPKLWGYNPQIVNPHLIYPGDILALEYVDGEPRLVLTRDGQRIEQTDGSPTLAAASPSSNPPNGKVERLSPRVRSESLDDAVPMIPIDAIQQFLVHPRVVDADTLEDAPYVVSNIDQRLISAAGHQIYVRGRMSREQTRYGIFRRNKPLYDTITGELLGYEILHVGDAKLLNIGDPSTLVITDNKMETLAGDVLLSNDNDGITHAYTPRLPDIRGEGRIISLIDAISQTGRNQVVVLNLGERSGVEIGDVLAIEQRGRTVVDPRGHRGFERVTLPNARTGVVMVFKTFDKVSYALVMESTRPVTVDDIVSGI